ncbi:MAG TPA: protein translocase subunit SecD [Solirubrobacterales bacterium]|nr:protein translocase subunit SecD [Solirubrobacterales bacterium]
MGSRRRNLFVLLFVVALVAVSGLIIVQKETKLGLDLQGGLELVYQGQTTRVGEEVSGEDIDQSISIIEERINELGVSEPEVARLGSEEITVSLPGVTDARRAEEQVGSTAQLYYYDWQANLIGPEKAIGGNPGLEPPPGPLKASEERWEDNNRSVTKELNQRLIQSGAYPTAYEAALLASEQEPVENCEECSVARPRYYLFEKAKPHDLISGPELAKKDLYVSPTGEKRPKDGIVVEVPAGTIVVSEYPTNESGETDKSVDPGWYALKDEPALSGNDITDPEQAYGPNNEPLVQFGFTDEGQDAFQEVTRRIAQRGQANAIGPVSGEQAEQLSQHFAVILENEVKTRPIINFAELPDGIDGRTGAQISGGFQSLQEAQDLATTLQIGALPINLKLISQTQVSASLGSEALDQGITAGLIGLILAIIFLIAFYRFLGVIATIGLVAYGVIFFALINLIPITLTLPGIAGLVLTIGVAADSNIVIFERIKEEVRAGRSMSSAIAAGYRHGISTIIDANVLTLLTAFILFVLATAGVKGFAFTLGVGTIVSLLTAVVFTQALLGNMSRSRLLRSRAFLGAGGEGKQWRFDFIGASRWFFSMSGVILIIGGFALATKQLNFGIDFESGTRIKVALQQPTDEEGVREALEAAGVAADGEIQQVDDPNLGSNVFQIQSHQLEPGEVREAEATLVDEFGVVKDGFDSTSVGPTFGQQIADSAITALIFSILVICGYIALRFEPKFAIPVMIAILHDILITAGIYSLTGKEVSSGTVAAFLTILGYSIYDTIIVFDRIRENIPRMPRAAFSQIVNRSMSEVLTRSLAAGFTTLLGVTSLMIFGGAVLQDFAFAMLVGIASGTYSSIFIASPVLNAWKEREPGFIRRRLRIAEVEGGHVPAYADEIETAKLARDDEPEVAAGPSVEAPAAEAAPTAVATVERTEPETGNGSGSLVEDDENGAGDGDGDEGSAERRQRNAERRARRKARRKHGRR